MACQHCGAALAATVTATGTGAVCLECGVTQPSVSQFTTSQPLDWGWDERSPDANTVGAKNRAR